MSVGSLCERLVTEYQISPEQCRQEVLAFLGELLNQNLCIPLLKPMLEANDSSTLRQF